MKTVRFVTLCLALALFATAVVPFSLRSPAALAVSAPAPASLSLSALPFYTLAFDNAAASTDYACSLVSQKPKDWTKMGRRNIFDASWTVRNTGNRVWSKNGVDFGYVSGTKMHSYESIYDLNKDVGLEKQITLVVDMVAPKTKGYYTAVWGLYNGSQAFCKVSVTISVNK